MFSRLLISLALVSPVLAQDGQQIYTLYCGACHGAEGQGGSGGSAPPLAASPWLAGDPDRAIKISLNGLEGPIEVLGTTYNLAMPAQGAILQDDQLAAVFTYVRSAWGNSAAAVTPDQVKTIRAAGVDRKTAWTAAELLSLHPLPLEKTALTGLTSQVYKGPFDHLPDFSTLKAENIEEEHDGFISLKDSTLKTDYAMVWEGNFEIPETGDYLIRLDADDSAKLFIDGNLSVEVLGIGPLDGSRSAGSSNALTKGSHRLRVEYLQNQGEQGITIGWRLMSGKIMNWLTDEKAKTPKAREIIRIQPTASRPVIYRNFIAGTSPRAIGVGFPGGFNLAWSADHLAPELLWTGDFIDGSYKWLSRGTDNNPPAGQNLVTLSTARLLPKEARFRGYKLDPAGNPAFSIQLGEQFILDSWHAEKDSLVRVLTLTGGKTPLAFPLPEIPADSKLQVTTENLAGSTTPQQLIPGKPATITYRWK